MAGFSTFAPVNGSTGTNGGATIGYISDNSTFTLTNSASNEATSGFASTAQSVATGFTAQFTYLYTPQVNSGTNSYGADGAVFTLQNSGTTALGQGGGQLGYSGITSAGGLAINTYDGYYGFTGAYGFNGTVASGTNPSTGNTFSNGVSVLNGDPIAVKLK